jgi:phage shock protein PspC (stress-responsive transcriptional regulator)
MKRLYRNTEEGKIAGVCSGLGDYFELDPVVCRLMMLLSLFIAGPLFYIIAWIVIPIQK